MSKVKKVAIPFAVLSLSATSALAAVPDNSLVIDNKAFSTERLFTTDGLAEINAFLGEQQDPKIYFNQEGMVTSGKFKDLFAPQGADLSDEDIAKWPVITYKDAQGNITEYEAGNGNPVNQNQAKVTAVTADNKSITITFDKELTEAPKAAELAVKDYIDGGEGKVVTLKDEDIALGTDKKSVVIATTEIPQTDKEQSVITGVSYKGAAEVKSAEFKVPAKSALTVSGVTAITKTSVEVTLDGTPDKAKAEDKASYTVKIGDAAVEVTAVAYSEATKSATLTVDLDGKVGKVAVNGKEAAEATDYKAPTQVAKALSATTIEVKFDEKVDKTEAEKVANYTLRYAVGLPTEYALQATAGAGKVQATATLQPDGQTVKLTIVSVNNGGTDIAGFLNNGLRNGEPYQVKVSSNIKDLANNAANTSYSASFLGTNQADSEAPKVVSATYTSSTGALTLNFDKAVQIHKADNSQLFDITKLSLTADGKTPVALTVADVASYVPTTSSAAINGSSLTIKLNAPAGTKVDALGDAVKVAYAVGAFKDVAGNDIAAGSTAVQKTAGLQLIGASYNEESNKLKLTFNNTVDITKIPDDLSGITIAGASIGTKGTQKLLTTSNSNVVEFQLAESQVDTDKAATRVAAVDGAAEAAAGTTDGVKVVVPDSLFKDTDGTALTTIGGSTTIKNAEYTADATAPVVQNVTISGLTATAGTLTIKFSEKVDSKVGNIVLAGIKFYDKTDLSKALTNGTLSTVTKLEADGSGSSNDEKFSDTWTINLATDTSNTTLAAALNGAKANGVVMTVDKDAVTDMNNTKIVAVDTAKAVPVQILVNNATPDVFKLTAVGSQLLKLNVGKNAGGGAGYDQGEGVDLDPASVQAATYVLVPTAGGPAVPVSKVEYNFDSNNDANVMVYTSAPLGTDKGYTLDVTGLKTATGVAVEQTAGSGKISASVAAGGTAITGTNVNAAPITLDKDSSGTFSAGDQIIFTFDAPIHLATGFKASDISINTKSNGDTFGSSTAAVNTQNPNQLVITLSADAKVSLNDIATYSDTGSKILNVDSNAAKIAGDGTTDKIVKPTTDKAPVIQSAVYTDTNKDGIVGATDTLVVTFDQNIKSNSATASDLLDDFSIAGADNHVQAVVISDKTATITLKDTADIAGTPTIKMSGNTINISSMWGTASTDTTGKAVSYSDTEAPKVQSVSYGTEGANKFLYIKLTEAVSLGSSPTFGDAFTVDADTGTIATGDVLSVDVADPTIVKVALTDGGDNVIVGLTNVNVKLSTAKVADASGNKLQKSTTVGYVVTQKQ